MRKIYSNKSDEETIPTRNDDDFELPPICGYGTIKYLRRIGKLSGPTKTDEKHMDTAIKERLQEFLNNRSYNRQELMDGFAASTQAMIDLDKAHEEDGEDEELPPICGTGMLKYLRRKRQEQEEQNKKQ